MKKLLVFSAAVLFVVIAGASNVSAYGGGIGFPPGYFDNPHPRPGLVCEWVTKENPNGKVIKVPRCHVERFEHQRSNYLRRISAFFDRVWRGGRG